MAKWNKRNLCNYYSGMYQYEKSTQISIPSIGAFVIIPDMELEFERGFIFQNTQELLVTKSGKYKVDWNIAFNDGNNNIFEGAVFVNSTAQEQTIGLRKLGSVDTGSMGGTGIILIAIGDIITLRIANMSNISNPEIDAANISLIRVDN